MKFLKNNLKVIIAFMIGIILAGGIVYAATSASLVTYTKPGTETEITVAEALNDLYKNYKKEIEFVGMYQSASWVQRYEPASVTISNLEAGEYMAVGFKTFSEGGNNQNHLYTFYNITSVTNATYEYIGDNKTIFKLIVPETANVVITFPKAFDTGTNCGGYAYLWLFK